MGRKRREQEQNVSHQPTRSKLTDSDKKPNIISHITLYDTLSFLGFTKKKCGKSCTLFSVDVTEEKKLEEKIPKTLPCQIRTITRSHHNDDMMI